MNKLLCAAALLAVLLPSSLFAQASDNVTVTFTIDETYTLSVGSGAAIPFGSVAAGATESVDQTVLNHASNTTYRVTVEAGQTHFDALDPANDGIKAVGDLAWSLDQLAWTPFSTTATNVETTLTGSGSTTVYYQLTVAGTEKADDYSIGLTYSALQN